MLLGSSQDRAIVERLPLEEQWLRNGIRRDPERYNFGLFTGVATWRGRMVGASAQAFALAREKSASQPAVDPPFGGRAALEALFQPFQKDLGVVLRAEVEVVGPRESDYRKQGGGPIEQGGGEQSRDKEAIEAADHGAVAMIFTGLRHFKH